MTRSIARTQARYEPRDPALDAGMLANPDETAPVYADWLQHEGHPRGELIALQLAREASPDDAALIEAERALLEAHGELLLGDAIDDTPERLGEEHHGWELHWRRGWIHRARLRRIGQHGHEAVARLFASPSARFLRELVIGCHMYGDQYNVNMSDAIILAPHNPPLRLLEHADFDNAEYDGIDISRAPLGDLEWLGEIYPELEDVVLKGRGDVTLGDDFALPRARRFAFRTSTMTRDLLALLLAAPWPNLEELELWFGDPDRGYGAEIDSPRPLAPLFDARAFPKLRTLRLLNAPFADDASAALAASPLAAQLDTSEISLGVRDGDRYRSVNE